MHNFGLGMPALLQGPIDVTVCYCRMKSQNRSMRVNLMKYMARQIETAHLYVRLN
jgi:hypothetical protein